MDGNDSRKMIKDRRAALLAENHKRRFEACPDFHIINTRAQQFASFLHANFDDFVPTLLEYETFEVAQDELYRSTDLFSNLSENAAYFTKKIGAIATFLPRNQPLYSLSCFALVPSYMSAEVHVRAPLAMHSFFFKLIEKLRISEFYSNVHVSRQSRETFLEERRKLRLNPLTNEHEPVTDVVIFTGTHANADKMRSLFSWRTLFIANGSGHNPVVICSDAQIDRAVKSVLRVQLYNQGQDCAAPNSILVHRSIYDDFLSLLRAEVKNVKVGRYCDRETRVGPISECRDLKRIQSLLVDNLDCLDKGTPGIIHTQQVLVEPTIILKPLAAGGNYVEHFAPLFFVQKYNEDAELKIYFEHPRYAPNAMYVTVYGSSDYVKRNLMQLRLDDKRPLHTPATIIHNSDLHAPGVERGVKPYGGYGRGASCLSIHGTIISQPTLAQRDIFEQLVLPTLPINFTRPVKLSNTLDYIQDVKKTCFKSSPVVHLNSYFSLKGESYVDLARQLYRQYEGRKKLTCLIRISPYCELQATKLREIMTCSIIARELIVLGITCSLIIQWCDMEELEVDYCIGETKYVGCPIYKIPDPFNHFSSLSNRFLHDFRKIMLELEVDYELLIQSSMYRRSIYTSTMLQLLLEQNECDINDYPFKIYSRFTGTHNTKILSYENERITYKCLDTSEIDVTHLNNQDIVILKQPFDLAATWKIFDVQFSPASLVFIDFYIKHCSIINTVTNRFCSAAPQFIEIKPVSIKNADDSITRDISVRSILEIYPAPIVNCIYQLAKLKETLIIYFNNTISRHYDGFDLLVFGDVAKNTTQSPMPFRQFLALGEIAKWNKLKLTNLLRELGFSDDSYSITERITCIRFWQQTYSTEKLERLLTKPNYEYGNRLCESRRRWIVQLRDAVAVNYSSLKQLQDAIYDLPQDASIPYKVHCNDVYNLLLAKDIGPQLATLLWVADRNSVLLLLDLNNTNACCAE